MQIIISRNLKNLQKVLNDYRKKNETIGLVPTMGSIHKGHLALVEKSKKISSKTVVTIFVNPTQFNNKKDYLSYPKNEKDDVALLKKIGVDIIFIPKIKEIYPPDFCTSISLSTYQNILCGKYRQNHFSGVATIVVKLFSIIKPNYGFFGEKDYQQYMIIKKVFKDLNIDVKLKLIKTVRDSKGLALSSRNLLLTKEETIKAQNLNLIIRKIISNKKNYVGEVLKIIKKKFENIGIDKTEYIEIRSTKDLHLAKDKDKIGKGKYRIFISVYIGKIRLIDNFKIT